MRILDVAPRSNCPPRRGSAVRAWNLLAELSRRHEVRQLAQTDDGAPQAPAPFDEMRLGGLPAAVAALGTRAWPRSPLTAGAGLRLAPPRELRHSLEWADVVLVEFPWQFEACRRLRRPDAPLVLSSHNVETDKFASWAEALRHPFARSLWLRYVARAEAAALAHADLVVTVSGPDSETFVTRFGVPPERVVEVPNAADTTTIAPVDAAARAKARSLLDLPERPTAMFIGNDVPPNRAGVAWVRRLAAAVPEATFLVVGATCEPERSGNFVSCGVVEDMRPHLAAADVSLCPIEHGGGTKIKLLEALAAGLPAVVFAESTHGLAVRHREHVVVAPKTVPALAAAVRELFEDAALAGSVGRAARALAVERYSWSRSAELLEAALTDLVQTSGRRSSASHSALAASTTRG